ERCGVPLWRRGVRACPAGDLDRECAPKGGDASAGGKEPCAQASRHAAGTDQHLARRRGVSNSRRGRGIAVSPGRPGLVRSEERGPRPRRRGAVRAPARRTDPRSGLTRRLWRAWHRSCSYILSAPEVRDSLMKQGMVPAPGSPEEISAQIRADVERWKKFIAETGITAD